MIPDHIIHVFTTETNRYPHQIILKYYNDNLPCSLKMWTNATWNKMYSFIALLMLIARNKHNSLKGYWLKDILLNSENFCVTMTRDRVLSNLRMLHFLDNE
jgi:hypothetical protein